MKEELEKSLDLANLWEWFEDKFGKEAAERYHGYETEQLIREIKRRIIEKLKKTIEEEEERSFARQRDTNDPKEYDFRRGLRFALRKIEEIMKEE